MNKKYGYEEVKQIIKEKLNLILVSNDYDNNREKLTLKDDLGYFYVGSFTHLINGHVPNKFHTTNPYSIRNIKLWMTLNDIPLELLNTEYKRSDSLLTFKDAEGYYYKMTLDNLKTSRTPDRFKTSNPYTLQNIELWCKLNNKEFELVKGQKYNGTHVKLKWFCFKCKDIFGIDWNSIYAGQGCAVCRGMQVGESNCLANKNPKLIKEWHPIKNGNLTPWDVTYGSKKIVWWICENNHDWESSITERTRKDNKASKCIKCNESYGVKNIKQTLSSLHIPFGKEYSFDDLRSDSNRLLRFDIPVFWDTNKTNLRLLCEFDGKQHFAWVRDWMSKEDFEKLRKHDVRKNEYCFKNNIILIRIPHWEYDNIETILYDVLINNNTNSKFIFNNRKI